MVKVIGCESQWRQFANGKVLVSPTHDYGLMQVNESWIPKAKELGFDIMTLEGNYAMGLWIYKNAGGISNWSCNKLI